MKSPILLIANPTARHASEKGINRAANLLRSGGWEVRVLFTAKKGDAEAFARNAPAKGISLIMAAGGDGTLNEVVNGIAYTDVPMAILPMGTTNVLAKELGIPEDLEGAVSRALEGRPRAISLGKITVGLPPSPLTRYFCLMAGIGFDGDAVYGFSTSLKRVSGKAAYVLSAIKTLVRYSPEPLTFSVDGKSCRGYSAIICKASRYGGDFKVAPDASLLTPPLYAVVMEGRRRFDILRYSLGIIRERHLRFKDVLYLKGDGVRIEGIANVQIDGDYFGKTPAVITTVPEAVTVIF